MFSDWRNLRDVLIVVVVPTLTFKNFKQNACVVHVYWNRRIVLIYTPCRLLIIIQKVAQKIRQAVENIFRPVNIGIIHENENSTLISNPIHLSMIASCIKRARTVRIARVN